MKKLFTLLSLIALFVISSQAQTVIISTGAAGTPSYNAGPIYRSSAGSAFDASRYSYLYTAAELAAAGITSGSVINLVGWAKNNTTTTTGGGIFRIYMKNTSAASFSNATETWANLNTGALQVYENLNQDIPATAAPNYIDFTLTSPFIYTGGSLEISTEWDINSVAGNPTTGTFEWLWSTVVDRIYGDGNTTLAGITTLSSTSNSISTIDDRRPFIKIAYSGGTTGIDVGALSLVAPAVSANNCYTSAEAVTVKIRNYSTNPIDFSVNPVTVTTNVTGAATQVLTGIVNIGTLAAASTFDVAMTGTVNMNAPGTYTFNAFTTVAGDVTPSNNAMPSVDITKAPLSAGTISASPNSYCVTGGTPTLSAAGADGYGSLQWQQSMTSGSGFTNIPGATTNPYTLTTAITQTMYYRLVASCNGSNATSGEATATLNNPQITSTTPGQSCGPGPATVTLGATGTGSVINWYDVATGGVPVGTGPTFTTPPISTNTTYYVATGSGGGVSNIGLPASLSPTQGFGTTNFGIVFDALSAFTLTSVDVYPISAAPGTPGTVTIDVVDGSGTVIHTATVNVIGNPIATATAQTVTLDFNILPGTNLKLRPGARSASISSLLFEPSATAPPGGNYGYPFVVPGVVSINHSTLSAPPGNNPRLNLYYYFYNWKVTTGCESARTPVLASIVPITITCPANIVLTSPVTSCNAIATYNPTVVGSPAPVLTYSFSGATTGSGSGTGSGRSFNVGVTTVTLTATNICGTRTCSFTVTVNSGQLPVITTQPTTRSACESGNTTLSVTATDAMSYQWEFYNGTTWVAVAGATASTYTVTNLVRNSNTNTYRVRVIGLCTSVTSTNATVFVLAKPQVGIVSNQSQLIPGSKFVLTAVVDRPAGTGSYVWFKNGIVIPGVSGGTLPARNIDDRGTYKFTFTDANGCVNTSADFEVSSIPTMEIFVYPNPSNGQFQIRYNNVVNEQATIFIYNSAGQVIYQRVVPTGTQTYARLDVNISNMAAGTYEIKLINGAGTILGSKLIVKSN